LYVGGLFSTEEEIQFDEQEIEFTYLEDWVGINPFRFDFSKTPHVIEVPVKSTEIVKVRIEIERMELSIFLAPTVSYGWQGEFSGGRRCWVSIKPDEARPYGWFERIIQRIGNLLTLCIGEPVFPRRMKGQPAHLNEVALKPKEVDIYLHLSEGNERIDVSHVGMPVPYVMIRDRVNSIIASWFAIHEEIEPVVGLLLSTYYNSHMYVETEFLTLIQSIEIFHRRLVGGSYLSVEEWQPHYEAMVSAIPGEIKAGHRAALKNRLKYGHEFSLRKRVENLIESLSADARNHITKDFADFADECARTWNTMVHEGGGSVLGKSLKELWTINRRLRALLNTLIWKRLGLDDRFSSDWYRRVE
jgi:hypothetical protein